MNKSLFGTVMKNKHLVSLFAALAVFTGVARAQFSPFTADYSFIVAGIVNPGDGQILGQLNAGIEIDFIGVNGGQGWDGTGGDFLSNMTVRVTNYGPATSAITGFWLMKPVSGSTISLIQDTPYTGSTDNWSLDTSLPNTMTGGDGQLGDPDQSNYFGASSGERLDIPGDSVGWFSFDISPKIFPFDVASWVSSSSPDDPLLFVRWQEVFESESGKGAGGPGFDPGVPEPSEVAALAMLGLGGILFARRRFTRKK
jgi:hypothetical protein